MTSERVTVFCDGSRVHPHRPVDVREFYQVKQDRWMADPVDEDVILDADDNPVGSEVWSKSMRRMRIAQGSWEYRTRWVVNCECSQRWRAREETADLIFNGLHDEGFRRISIRELKRGTGG